MFFRIIIFTVFFSELTQWTITAELYVLEKSSKRRGGKQCERTLLLPVVTLPEVTDEWEVTDRVRREVYSNAFVRIQHEMVQPAQEEVRGFGGVDLALFHPSFPPWGRRQVVCLWEA